MAECGYLFFNDKQAKAASPWGRVDIFLSHRVHSGLFKKKLRAQIHNCVSLFLIL